MRNPRLWRELLIRGGITFAFAAIAVVFLKADPWIWVVPLGVTMLVVLKHVMGPKDDASAEFDDERPDNA